jgi:hypothetical protein
MQNYLEQLRSITEILLKPEDDFGEISSAINNLFSLFSEVTELQADDERNRKDIYISKGKAIGTTWAALCVKELMRTKYFLRGLYGGIKEAQNRFPNTRIHILYAGTGPFAALAIPMTAIFSSEEISFTLLEINPASIAHLEKCICAFQAENYINEIVQCDATAYQTDKSNPIHIVLTETMLNALQKEPQVSITMNLVPQMLPEGILIPQNIRIDAALLSPKKNAERMTNPDFGNQKYYHPLKTIFELNKTTPKQHPIKRIADISSYAFPEVLTELPEDLEPGYNELDLLTSIQVFGDVELAYNQCSLNLPKKLMHIDQNTLSSRKIMFQYVISEKPGFQYRFV